MYYKLVKEGVRCFTFSRDKARNMNVLVVWEVLLKLGGSCVSFVNWLWLTHCFPPQKRAPQSSLQRSPTSAAQRYNAKVQCKGTMQRCNELYSSWMDLDHQNKWSVHQQTFSSNCTKCHIRSLFVNRHRLATNSPIYKWDIVPPGFFRHLGELGLVSSTVRRLCVDGCTPLTNFRFLWTRLILLTIH